MSSETRRFDGNHPWKLKAARNTKAKARREELEALDVVHDEEDTVEADDGDLDPGAIRRLLTDRSVDDLYEDSYDAMTGREKKKPGPKKVVKRRYSTDHFEPVLVRPLKPPGRK